MTDAAVPEEANRPKGSKLPLIAGFALMILGGGGGFFAVSSGMILGGESKTAPEKPEAVSTGIGDVRFIPIEPISVSLAPDSGYRHLRFRAQLEVIKDHKSEVETILPRIVNVLNGYLRAVQVSDLADPASLTRFRTQLLRRAQIVAGPGRINDLLIMEFVLN